jgi:hypothetical protein
MAKGNWNPNVIKPLTPAVGQSQSVQCVVTSPPYYGLRSYLADDDPGLVVYENPD